MVLADSSAWIEYDRGTESAVHVRLRELVAKQAEPLGVTEPVLMEVLAGARSDEREEQLRRLLLRHHWLPVDAVVDYDAAARIYRRCRAHGVTPRGLLDCLIAAVADRNGAALLTADGDLRRVAAAIGLRLA